VERGTDRTVADMSRLTQKQHRKALQAGFDAGICLIGAPKPPKSVSLCGGAAGFYARTFVFSRPANCIFMYKIKKLHLKDTRNLSVIVIFQ